MTNTQPSLKVNCNIGHFDMRKSEVFAGDIKRQWKEGHLHPHLQPAEFTSVTAVGANYGPLESIFLASSLHL